MLVVSTLQTLTQHRCIVGLPSTTSCQHWANIPCFICLQGIGHLVALNRWCVWMCSSASDCSGKRASKLPTQQFYWDTPAWRGSSLHRKPASTRHWTNVGLMLGQCRRHWTNVKSTLVQYRVFDGKAFIVSHFSPYTQALSLCYVPVGL